MLKCNWRKWIWPWGLLPLALGGAALLFNSDSLENNLAGSAGDALKAGGGEWASVMMDGRDATVTGEAPDQEAIDKAVQMVAGTYGVRRVDVSKVTIVEPVVLDPPTVDKASGVGEVREITGTWPEGVATTLAVEVGGAMYKLGEGNALTSDGSGKWKLVPPTPLKEGNYDVEVKITDGKRAESAINTEGAVVVAPVPTPPAEPAMSEISGGNPPTLTGTWPEGDGNALAVALGGKSYELGKDSELTSDGNGKWSLTPAEKLSDGNYDVVVTVTNKDNLTSSAKSVAPVAIKTPPPGTPEIVSASKSNPPQISGTWPEQEGNSLSVDFAGKSYVLGSDKELSSDGSGNWTLNPADKLADGSYDASIKVTNSAGKVSESSLVGFVSVDETPPAAPTVNKVETRSVRPSVTGTWPEDDAKKLSVEVAGRTYELGKDGGLTSDGSGNWTLKLDGDLTDNTYDVVATATDAAGNSAKDRGFGEVVIDSSAPAAPTVNTLLTRQRQPAITGAWPSKDAKKLTVSVGGRTYVAGAGDGLTADGDNWTLRVSDNLEDGTYNVKAEASDSLGNAATDASSDELTVDATPPEVPTVNAYKSDLNKPTLTGTFPEGDASTMAVTIEGQTFALGTSSGLNSNGKGKWSLNTGKEYAPGTYDVQVLVADKAGNQRSDTTTGEIVILEPPKPEPAPEPEPQVAEAEPEPAPEPQPAAVNCQALFDEALKDDNIKFASAKSRILSDSNGLLDKLADVIKQCPDSEVEIGGHTDSSGSQSYNQALSERRANAVRDALVERGANAGNLSAVGYGESKPVADNKTREGRAANRRTEFKVQN